MLETALAAMKVDAFVATTADAGLVAAAAGEAPAATPANARAAAAMILRNFILMAPLLSRRTGEVPVRAIRHAEPVRRLRFSLKKKGLRISRSPFLSGSALCDGQIVALGRAGVELART